LGPFRIVAAVAHLAHHAAVLLLNKTQDDLLVGSVLDRLGVPMPPRVEEGAAYSTSVLCPVIIFLPVDQCRPPRGDGQSSSDPSKAAPARRKVSRRASGMRIGWNVFM